MEHGSCIHLEELRSTLRSILRLDLLFTVHCRIFIFVSPAKQRRDICIAFPAASLSSSSSVSAA